MRRYIEMKIVITLILLLTTNIVYSKSILCKIELKNKIAKTVSLQLKEGEGRWQTIKVDANSSLQFSYRSGPEIKWFLISPKRDALEHEGTFKGCKKTLIINGVNSI